MIDEAGKYARDIKDLEDQVLNVVANNIEQLWKIKMLMHFSVLQIRDNSNNVEEALKQVLDDLKRVKDEQLYLLKEIRKFSNSDGND
jgi:predicted P-loop ATPase/GTPase